MTDQAQIFTEAVKLMSEEMRKKQRRCMRPFRNLEVLATSETQFDLCAVGRGLTEQVSILYASLPIDLSVLL